MSPRVKLILVILVPILIGCSAGTIASWRWAVEHTEAQSRRFANALVDQLAITVSDPLIQGDVLSLNVMLNDVLERGDVAYASIYGTNNSLVAQVGRRTESIVLFNRDVTFQNASAGYVQIGLDHNAIAAKLAGALVTGVLVTTIIVVLITALLWRYGDLVFLWLTRTGELISAPSRASGQNGTAVMEPAESGERTVLVIKIRPARHIDEHLQKIFQAVALYGGDGALTDGDDVIVLFNRDNQVPNAICTAELVETLMSRAKGNITTKLGLHTCNETDEDLDKARKHTTYLASIADNSLLASKAVFHSCGDQSQFRLEKYHSSLTPDGEVYFLDTVNETSRALIERQADQLTQTG